MLKKIAIQKLITLKFKLMALSYGFMFLIGVLLFVSIFISDEDSNPNRHNHHLDSHISLLTPEVLQHKELVEIYAKKYGISEYVYTLLAIIQVESGGVLPDVMQSSESAGLPSNTIDNVEQSINQGTKYFADLLSKAQASNVDEDTILQAYNYGSGFIDYIAQRGKRYTFDYAMEFAREKSNDTKVDYPNPIAIKINGGWRYKYGNMFYVMLIRQYLPSMQFDDKDVQKIMDEALKFLGWKYVFGGSNPDTSFDCSGLTQWCYKKVGIHLPRTAQEQYDITQHISIEQAKAGDLVFFHSTYNAGTYVTHVGIYVGNMQMYNAGDPIGYANLNNTYWQERLIGVGRILR